MRRSTVQSYNWALSYFWFFGWDYSFCEPRLTFWLWAEDGSAKAEPKRAAGGQSGCVLPPLG